MSGKIKWQMGVARVVSGDAQPESRMLLEALERIEAKLDVLISRGRRSRRTRKGSPKVRSPA